eukprot:TRINITY_DN25246_c0_g1_i1.p1 TRINITY_DN25246_c0_g1~~TRINITY_DN25246_c0_g1_i1.p1  ORF type:complete len:104 (-),score=2.29 TRINITY_DN25246_c0_g1_i1:89-400(-)
MIIVKLYLLWIPLLVMTYHGLAKPTDIHIHLHGVGIKEPTGDKPRGEAEIETNSEEPYLDGGHPNFPFFMEPIIMNGDKDPILHQICGVCGSQCPPSCHPHHE